MTIWLLLKDQQDDRGLAVAIKPPELAPDLPNSELENLVVGAARFNGDSAGDAAQSVARGGVAALRLMARQYRNVWPAAPLKRLRVETLTPLAGSYDGRSGDLLFALATFLRLAELSGLARAPAMDFAATGTLDPDGVVGPVGGVVAKIEAAIDQLPRGSFVFYPKERPEGEARWIDETLKERARKRGIEPFEVGFFEEALVALGINILGWRRDQPPYRALSTYEVEHSPIFFGRDDQVTKFLERLQHAADAQRPGGLVEAASGAGKSSFVQAGLLARLRILPSKDRSSVEYAVWQPRLASSGQATEIDEAALTKSVLLNWKTHAGVNSTGFSGLDSLKDVDTLEHLGSALSSKVLAGRRLVWVVDQFEELFTQKYTDPARIALARFMAQLQHMGVWVIATLRTEFKSRFMALADEQGNAILVDVFENLMFPLARMRDEAMGQMITEPAKVAGVSFETRADGVRLDELLREEALGADSMPLVGYALNELWLKRRFPERVDEHGRTTPLLTFEAYRAICGGQEAGGIKRVLGIEAERAFSGLSQQARDELPRLLDALAVPVEGEEKEAAKPADLSQWEEGTPGWQLIEALREKRLLITEPATGTTPAQVRVVHEALFEGWESARIALDGTRVRRLQIEDLRRSEGKWRNGGRPKEWLLTSPKDLETAKASLKFLGNDEFDLRLSEFLTTSIESEEAKQVEVRKAAERVRLIDRRRIRRLAAISVVAVLAAGFALVKSNEATRNATVAGEQRARAEVEQRNATAAKEQAEKERAVAVAATQQARTEAIKAEAAASAELLARQAAQVQTSLAEERGRLANASRQLTQATLDGTVDQVSKPSFQEDAQLEGIQAAVLDRLTPIYKMQLGDGRAGGQASSSIGYAAMIDRIARMQASNQSFDTATSNYQDAWRSLQRQGLQNAPDSRIDTFVENYALTLLAAGDPDSASAAIAARHQPVVLPKSRQCTLFRIDMMRLTLQGTDVDRAESIFNATVEWVPSDPAEVVVRLACLSDLAELFAHTNEDSLFVAAFNEFKKGTEAGLVEKPRSVSLLLMSAQVDMFIARWNAKLGKPNEMAAAALDQAESKIVKAWNISPKSRQVIDSVILLVAAKRELQSSDAAGLKAFMSSPMVSDIASEWATSSSIAPTFPWLSMYDTLIKRDPDSPALARRFGYQVSQTAQGFMKQQNPPKNANLCHLLLEVVLQVKDRYPKSLVAANAVLAAKPCLEKIKDPALGLEDFSRAYTSVSLLAHIRRLDRLDASGLRARILGGAFRDLQRAGTEESINLMYGIANAEAKSKSQSIRFTRAAWFAVLEMAKLDSRSGKKPTSNELIKWCKGNSAPQIAYCEGAAITLDADEVSDGAELDRLVKSARPNWSVVSLEERSPNFDLLEAPATATLVVRRRNGVLEFFDDVQVSREYGVDPAIVSRQMRLRDKWVGDIRRAASNGISVSDATNLVSGRYGAIEAPSHLRGTVNWWNTVAGKSYIQDLETKVYADQGRGKQNQGPSSPGAAAPVASASLDDALLNEEVTVLLQGKNIYGDTIFTYLLLSLRQLQKLRDVMLQGADFMPSDFGKVVAAAKGFPSRAMRRELTKLYNMVDIPRRRLYEYSLE